MSYLGIVYVTRKEIDFIQDMINNEELDRNILYEYVIRVVD